MADIKNEQNEGFFAYGQFTLFETCLSLLIIINQCLFWYVASIFNISHFKIKTV